MIKEIHIIHQQSGVPLINVNLNDQDVSENISSVLFSGVIKGIEVFLKECKIGDLTEFTTNENRIEVRCDKGIIVAVVADINDPPHNIVDLITEDIGALFVSLYEDKIETFDGDVSQFEPFIPELKDFIRIQLDEISTDDISSPKPSFSNLENVEINQQSKEYLELFIDWVKNRYDPDAFVQKEIVILCPPDKSHLSVDILLEGGMRKMNKLDRWLSKRMGKGGVRNIVFVVELGVSHGPAQIRQILKKIINLGNPKFTQEGYYPWFPAEVLFFGANVQKKSFEGLQDIIKSYKSHKIIVPAYADHIHREHSPHHEFFRCKVTAWKWNLSTITINNVPVQIFI